MDSELVRILHEALECIELARRVPQLEARIAELESQRPAAQAGAATKPPLAITTDPDSWPRRASKGNGSLPTQGRIEYAANEVDLEIAKVILRRAPGTWKEVRLDIARIRRLTPQQVAELKARITRHNLLAA